MEKITYEQLTAKHKLCDIAIKLGYITPKSSNERKVGAMARIANWKRTGIPERVLRIKRRELEELIK